MCLPLRRASVFLRQRAREWTVTGLRMMRPSFTSLRICWPETNERHVNEGRPNSTWAKTYKCLGLPSTVGAKTSNWDQNSSQCSPSLQVTEVSFNLETKVKGIKCARALDQRKKMKRCVRYTEQIDNCQSLTNYFKTLLYSSQSPRSCATLFRKMLRFFHSHQKWQHSLT